MALSSGDPLPQVFDEIRPGVFTSTVILIQHLCTVDWALGAASCHVRPPTKQTARLGKGSRLV